MTTFFKEPVFRSVAYKKFIAGKLCSICGSRSQSAPHHAQEKGDGKMGGKTSDRNCVPLCPFHHRQYHDIGRDSFHRKHPFWRPERLIESFNREWEQLKGEDAWRESRK